MILRGLQRFALLFLAFAAVFVAVGLGFGVLVGAETTRSIVGGLIAGGCLLTFVALFSAVGGPGGARPFARGAPVAGVGGYILTDEVRRRGVGELGVFLAAGVGLVLLALGVSELS